MFTEALGAYLTVRMADIPEEPVLTYGLPGAAAGKNAVCICLYTIAEDAALRSYDKNYARVAGAWIARPLPLRLKCGFVVSAWPAATDTSEAALVQQNLLSAAFGALALSNTVPSAYLPAPLKADDLQKPVIALTNDALLKDPAFWASFGCPYRPSFSFDATVSLPVSESQYDHTVEGLDITYKNGLVL